MTDKTGYFHDNMMVAYYSTFLHIIYLVIFSFEIIEGGNRIKTSRKMLNVKK